MSIEQYPDVLESMRKAPFHLEDDDIEWVSSTLAGLSTKDKVGQLFCGIATGFSEEALDATLRVCTPGGVMYRPCTTEEAVAFTALLRKKVTIPMLIAANLEKGANGIVREGTFLGSPLAVGATGDVSMAAKLGEVCGSEGAAVGANWAFAPIIDIDYNFRNPITNIRTFGSDPARVRDMGAAYVKAVQSHGVAASIKHFPGDGRDERDQHLVTSINDMSVEDWDATYGAAYKAGIEAGAMTVMVGHIMQPAYSKALRPDLADADIMPATLSPEIMGDLLRGKLGFNGLVVTDATTMAGFTIPMPRSKAVPTAIASGADVFLFTRNLEEDFGFMMDGVADGTISPSRLDAAVARVLGLKAALRLRERPAPTLEAARAVVGSEEHQAWSRECADEAITLVKEEIGVLPLTPAKYPKLLYVPIEAEQGVAYSVRAGACDIIRTKLEAEGFEIDVFKAKNFFEGEVDRTSDFIGVYDAILYVANLSTKSNQTTVRIEWAQPMGANCPHYLASIPTVFVSIENPYHLIDIPRVKTFINTYNSGDNTLDALVEKLLGRSEFKGTSPVDAFCGRWDTRL
ncbi:MAG TPA: glycoside hydrolase family 3 N-terminal domain-containing protein [Propionibacteriaceae bacterium]|nr:glycoside hydrolase family 3 N-terminal domain-containing protein [Propionibacteriaceae bacterium]